MRALALFLLMSAALLLPVAAAEPEDIDEQYAIGESSLDDILGQLMEEYPTLSENTFAMAYYNTGTDELWTYNADKRFYAASLYKLPLNMIYSELFYDGTLDEDFRLYGYTYWQIQEYSLVYSSNEFSEMLQYSVDDYADVTVKLTQFCNTGKTVPESCISNRVFSANEMLGILRELYTNGERYPGVLDCMLEAQPDSFFRFYEDRFDIAQKYGSYEGSLNTVGIVYTPTPFMLVVLTDGSVGSNYLIGRICRIMAEYTIDAEPEPTPSPTPEPTPEPTSEPEPSPSAEVLESAPPESTAEGAHAGIVLLAAAAGIAVVAVIAIVQTKSRRK